MKKLKWNIVAYWIFTVLVAFGMLGSGIAQVLHDKAMIDLITPLGYPVYFLTIIGIWKILAAIVIVIPGYKLIKEWAYAGLFFVMTGAVFSHIAVGDTMASIPALFQTAFIVLSWYFRPTDRRIVPIIK